MDVNRPSPIAAPQGTVAAPKPYDVDARHIVECVAGRRDTLGPYTGHKGRAYFKRCARPHNDWLLEAPVCLQVPTGVEASTTHAPRGTRRSHQAQTVPAFEEVLLVQRIMAAPLRPEHIHDACIQTQLFALLDNVHALPRERAALIDRDLAHVACQSLDGLCNASRKRPLCDAAVRAYLAAQIDVWRAQPQPAVVLHGDVRHDNILTDSAERLWLIDWGVAHLGDPLEDIANPLVHADVDIDDEEGILGLALHRLQVPEQTRLRFSAVMAVLEVQLYAYQAALTTDASNMPSLATLAERLQRRSGQSLTAAPL